MSQTAVGSEIRGDDGSKHFGRCRAQKEKGYKMKRRFLKAVSLTAAAFLCMSMCACGKQEIKENAGGNENIGQQEEGGVLNGEANISNEIISKNNFKSLYTNNPISPDFFCADPTAVEYNGRLYVIGTNDHQQYEIIGPEKDNSYEKIKSFVIMSTDDMVNWTYHGEIDVEKIAPWIVNSWAPSIVSREEEDGLTHFYLYFSNNGMGVGVITTTDLLGEWEDPLGEPLITTFTPGLGDCPNPFDPGVVIDENGDGWLAFGGGKSEDGTEYMPGTSRIVKLGDDLLSFDSEFAEIPAPYFFEASELNYINGTYVYTYNTDWNNHSEKWEYDCEAPSMCSMVYMTTKTPLDSSSWEMRGEYFENPGTSGLDYSNNHTHLHKYNGEYYIFYHTLMLKGGMGINGAYRSLGVDRILVDEDTVTIEPTGGTRQGIDYVSSVNPYEENNAVSLNNTADMKISTGTKANPSVTSTVNGAWISIKNVEFSESESILNENGLDFTAKVKGSGRLEVRTDAPDGDVIAAVEFDDYSEIITVTGEVAGQIGGIKNLYLVCSEADIEIFSWQFTEK